MADLKTVKNKYLAASDGDVLGVTDNKDNVSLLGFKLAAADSLAKFNLKDGFSDSFTDTSGIDTGNSTGTKVGSYYHGSWQYVSGNWFGDYDLGSCTFSSSGITQTGQTTNISTRLTTGTVGGGPGASSYGQLTAGHGLYSDSASSIVPNGTSGCYELTVANKNGSYDGDMVLVKFQDLTIDSGVTLTTDQPCKGLFVMVEGDCTINGSISMTARGAAAAATSVNATGLRLPLFTSGGTDTLAAADFTGTGTAVPAELSGNYGISGDGTIFTISKTGGAAGGASSSGNSYPGTAGTSTSTTVSPGGGGGGLGQGTGTSGAGAAGIVWAGGGGGGGAKTHPSFPGSAGAATANGGAGGNGAGGGGNAGFGGSGNPGGAGSGDDGYGGNLTNELAKGNTGVGGLLILLVRGNLTIGASGTVEAKGTPGKMSSSTSLMPYHATGGGSGGGSVLAFYGGTLSNSGSVTAAGGTGNYYSNTSYDAGSGGDGGTILTQVSQSNRTFNNLDLRSNAVSAVSQPTTARITLFQEDVDSGTINTDIKAFVSRDGGTTYTQTTLVDQGSWESGKKIYSGSVDISGQPAGTSMKYKVTTHNSKDIRVHGVSLAWS